MLEMLILLGVSSFLMFSAPLIYSKFIAPPSFYEGYTVVDKFPSCHWTDYYTITLQKHRQTWRILVTKDVYGQLHIGNCIDFYYNWDESVSRFRLNFRQSG